MSVQLRLVQADVADCMDAILRNFRSGAKITILVRQPDAPTQDFVMTNDDLEEVQEMIARTKAGHGDASNG